jgi:pimeloyl-ACP methyl ester carboxylesterase
MPMIESRARFRVDDVDCLQAAEQIQAPMLLLAGEEDVRMPPEMVKRIYEKAAGPKEFWVIPGEGHENRNFGQEFRDKIKQFFMKVQRDP